MLDQIAAAASRHLVLPAGAADAVALWILHAHAHDTAAISPILAFTSPTPECGKTTAPILLSALVPRPLPASNITAAAIFWGVEKWMPTLLIDEADTFLRDSDDLRGVLNSGHCRSGAFVIRTHGKDHEPRSDLLRPAPEDALQSWSVSPRVNSSRYQQLDAVAPVDDQG